MARYLYSELSSAVQARQNCIASKNDEWLTRHSERIESLVKNYMPSGSGFDHGTTLDLESSHADKLVFRTSFHHMDKYGSYSGWTEHTVTVSPSLSSRFHLRVSGRDKNDIKDMVAEVFHTALSADIQPDMEFAVIAEKTGCKLVSRWLDSCTQVWDVIIPKREHVWTPAVGELVKLKTFSDYSKYRIRTAWAWLKVISVNDFGQVYTEHWNTALTGEYFDIALPDIAVPLNWAPVYDTDEIIVSGCKTWMDAKQQAVVALA